MITIDSISRQFPGVQALKSVSLHVKEGELHGLIGPDGSGKTTLFRILTTLILPDQGRASIGKYAGLGTTYQYNQSPCSFYEGYPHDYAERICTPGRYG
jgi:ABC-type multidrug transport system ATPase subunit